ncbi:hypothetical protein ELH75_21890 [Rhizobium leguminosarum]|uniref:hypothetical protein n=1 Tax=Rhizobium leguminosarum TaxID=384 RepID=UPI0010323D80|nr:hypothetical protein [Rhizobium leguminosarum]QIO73923.1 hypothetical protein HA459_18645 [Rhizobium leguminosarum bv. trifolii]QIO80942.1 hypothetical protein HA460_18685 [Rhizobium leguminosarum bv. trifolii]TAU22566.1 hypothetical protein ELI50_19160 [Rhizobium leguminosarum]TAU42562.1 hypothetical protein ELI51_19885 [Rhizobium leguminosarum]TAV12975.1 hypothetical protein ELI37_21915 [Rhizobium leguminosarum]
MTLIASFKWRQMYFAFGDALITTSKRINEDTPIPTQNLPNETEQMDGIGIWVAGLTRKIFTIGPYLVFGWSGPMANFKNALRYLYASALDKPVSVADLQAICKRAGLPRDQASAWFIDAFTRDRGLVEISHNLQKIAQEKDGAILVGGSGAKSFRERLDIDTAPEINGVSLFERTLVAQARYLLEQHRQGHHLDQGFGGAFEFITCESGYFASFDRLLIVFRDYWDAEAESDAIKNAENVSRVGDTCSKIDAAYYMTHVDDQLIVCRWFPGSYKIFAVPRPFSDDGRALAGASRFGVDHVIEVLSHHSGKSSTVLQPRPDEYNFEVLANGARLTLPMSLTVDLENALRKHLAEKTR